MELKGVVYRLLVKNDIPEICKLMEKIKVPIADLFDRSIYLAVSKK